MASTSAVEIFSLYPRIRGSTTPTVMDALRRNSQEVRAWILDILSHYGLKDPVSIISSYTHPSEETLRKLSEFRQYIIIGREFARETMVYIHRLSDAVGGQDLLGYEHLFHNRPCYDEGFISRMEHMVLTEMKICHDTIIECHNMNAVSSLIHPITNDIKDRVIDESYFNCIPSNRVEGKIPDLVTCPYCLDIPIKYSYYKSGHKKTKKHVLNREKALKGRNYYRHLLKRFQPDYEGLNCP